MRIYHTRNLYPAWSVISIWTCQWLYRIAQTISETPKPYHDGSVGHSRQGGTVGREGHSWQGSHEGKLKQQNATYYDPYYHSTLFIFPKNLANTVNVCLSMASPPDVATFAL